METPGKTGNGAPGAIDFVTLFLAARILRTAGFDATSTAKVLKEVYGVEVEPSRFNTVPEEVKRRPVLRRFVQSLTKDRLWALRYLAGAMLGDGDKYGELKVTDISFAKAYAEALAVVTGDPNTAIVREKKDGYHTRCCRPLAQHVREGLWKVLALLDKLDEKKHFLSGLLDAEGSISPKIDGRYKSLSTFQITFTNTSKELAVFVRDMLKELGFKTYLHVQKRQPISIINGKKAIRKKPLYAVHAFGNISKVAVLTCLSLHCERKKKMLEFFLAVKDLPPSERYEALKYCWEKKNGKWWTSRPIEEYLRLRAQDQAHDRCSREPIERQRHTKKRPIEERRDYTMPVICPMCLSPGTLALVAGALTRIRVDHEWGFCELGTVNVIGEGKRGGTLAVCSKCGKPGYIYAAIDKDPLYPCLRVRVVHHDENRKCCTLMCLKLAQPNTKQSQPQPHPRT